MTRMRVFVVAGLMGVILGSCVLYAQGATAAAPAAGEAVNGLKLTLAADKTELRMRPIAVLQATKDTPRWEVEPVKLTFTFTNVSAKPIKLDTYNLLWNRLELRVQGPDAESVRTVVLPMEALLAIKRAEDYPTIDPGKSWTYKLEPQFPGLYGGTEYTLMKPGEYRLHVTYDRPKRDYSAKDEAESWVGTVTSNEILLKGIPAEGGTGAKTGTAVTPAASGGGGLAVDGLVLTLAADKTELAMRADGTVEPTKLTVTFTNVSDKPLKLNTFRWALGLMTLDVKGPDADSVRAGRVMFMVVALPPKPEDFPILEPGKSWTDKNRPGFPGLFGQAIYTLLKPGEYRVKAVYACTEAHQKQSELAAGCWVGSVLSNEVVLKVAK